MSIDGCWSFAGHTRAVSGVLHMDASRSIVGGPGQAAGGRFDSKRTVDRTRGDESRCMNRPAIQNG
jgi:hypothetical protein